MEEKGGRCSSGDKCFISKGNLQTAVRLFLLSAQAEGRGWWLYRRLSGPLTSAGSVNVFMRLSVGLRERAVCRRLSGRSQRKKHKLLDGDFLIYRKGSHTSLNLPLTIIRVDTKPVWPVLSQCCCVCSEPASRSLLCTSLLNNCFQSTFERSLSLIWGLNL